MRIWDEAGKIVFDAERQDASCVRFRHAVRFPILKSEVVLDEPGRSRLWVRGGRMVIRGRGVHRTGQIGGVVEYAQIERALAAKAARKGS